MHIVVIGAGVIGACCAYRLAEAGHDVTIVDASPEPAGASTASFGWLNASFHLSPDHFTLRNQALAAHRRLEADLGAYANWCGALVWDMPPAELAALCGQLAALGYPADLLSASHIAQLPTGLTALPDQAMFCPAEGVSDPGELAKRARAAARGLGARSMTGFAVTALKTRGDRVVGLRHAAGTLDADCVLVAAGMGAPGLMSPLGHSLPLPPRPGLIVRSTPIEARLGPILVAPEGEIRQLADGSLLHPAAAGHQGDASETVDNPRQAADAAVERLSRLFGTTIGWQSIALGWRPVPQDGLPVLGHAQDGLYVAVMHSGATLAPRIAEIAAAEIAGDNLPGLDTFRPGRF